MFFFGRCYWLLAVTVMSILNFVDCPARSQRLSAPQQAIQETTLPSTHSALSLERGTRGTTGKAIVIIPGQSVGPLRIGDLRQAAVSQLGQPNEEYTFDENSLGPCRYTEAHWLDLEHDDRWGIFTYSNNDRIYQIMVDTPRYSTTDGLTSDSSPEQVRRRFPKTEAYILLGSGSKVVGGRDLIYWVDRSAGIAFEFYFHQKLKRRRVGRIIVFEKGRLFLPAGCISPPQELRQLKPLSLEPSVN